MNVRPLAQILMGIFRAQGIALANANAVSRVFMRMIFIIGKTVSLFALSVPRSLSPQSFFNSSIAIILKISLICSTDKVEFLKPSKANKCS